MLSQYNLQQDTSLQSMDFIAKKSSIFFGGLQIIDAVEGKPIS